MASRDGKCLATNFTAVVLTDDIEHVFEVVSEEKDIDWEKFGSFRSMTRMFAYCCRFQSKIKGKVVTTEELQQVIQILLRKSQIESFGPTYQALTAGKPMGASDQFEQFIIIFGRSGPHAIKRTHVSCGCELRNETFTSAICETSKSEKID